MMIHLKTTGKVLLFGMIAAFAIQANAEDKIVFSENFDSPDALKKWHVVEYPGSGTFHLEKGALAVVHKNNPGKGSYIEIPVPNISRGQIDFDVLIDPEHAEPERKIGLTFELYNIATFWHDSLSDWRLYFPEPNAKRMANFNFEPVGHHKIAKVEKYKYVHYRICFDEKQDLVEFYTGDMNDPKAARYDVSVFGHAFYRGGYLRIGSFAFTTDQYKTLVDNIVIRECSGATEKLKKDQILIFDGISSNHFKVVPLLKKMNLWKKTGARCYAWNSPGPNLLADKNNCVYEKMPGFQTVGKAALIIFNDAPNVEPSLQKEILKSVYDGADLLILSGLFSLKNGGFNGSPIGEKLPVILNDDWTVKGDADTPVLLDQNNLVTENNSVMYHYWDLKPEKDAEILATAGNGKIPILLRKKFGQGSITVLTATACGPAKNNSFWKTSILENIINYLHNN